MVDILGRQMQKQGAPFWVLPHSPGLLGPYSICPHGGALERAGIWILEALWMQGGLTQTVLPSSPGQGWGLSLPVMPAPSAGRVPGEAQEMLPCVSDEQPGHHQEALSSCLPGVPVSLGRQGGWGQGCTAFRDPLVEALEGRPRASSSCPGLSWGASLLDCVCLVGGSRQASLPQAQREVGGRRGLDHCGIGTPKSMVGKPTLHEDGGVFPPSPPLLP